MYISGKAATGNEYTAFPGATFRFCDGRTLISNVLRVSMPSRLPESSNSSQSSPDPQHSSVLDKSTQQGASKPAYHEAPNVFKSRPASQSRSVVHSTPGTSSLPKVPTVVDASRHENSSDRPNFRPLSSGSLRDDTGQRSKPSELKLPKRISQFLEKPPLDIPKADGFQDTSSRRVRQKMDTHKSAD